jgi:integrase
MSDEIVVMVVDRGRRYLYLRYVDPIDGKVHEKSAKTDKQKAAQRAAWEWQAELNAGGGTSSGVVRWSLFRTEFMLNYLNSFSDGYASNVNGSLNVVEELMSPDTLARINDAWIARFHLLAKKRTVSPSTVKKYFQHLMTALNWAKDRGYIKNVPVLSKQLRQSNRGGKLMKGRPITGEEYERMVQAVEVALLDGPRKKEDPVPGKITARVPRKPSDETLAKSAASIRYLMEGLWQSGLRLGEALSLTWDQWADGIRIRVDGEKDVCLMIDGGNQKNRKTQVYPVVDDFAEFLLKTPKEARHGFVFNPIGINGKVSRRVDTVSNWIVDVGAVAAVKVDEQNGREKFASAHDFRRAFGTRWAKIVPASLLQQLMRHSSIETTMSFYVNITAKDTMEEVRRHVRKNLPIEQVHPEESETEI